MGAIHDSEKRLKELFDLEQALGIKQKDRFHNSEEGKKQYEALFENHPSCKDVKSDEAIEELTAKLERYRRGGINSRFIS